MEVIERMYESDARDYDQRPQNKFPDARSGVWPHNRRVIGGLIQNDVSL